MRKKILFFILLLSIGLCGCDAFVRKFTRRPKKDLSKDQEMVLVPEQYSSLFATVDDAYRQYFSFWQAWQTEFLNSLLERSSHKKKLSCLNEAIKNLKMLEELLQEEKRPGLIKYIDELNNLRSKLAGDPYATQFNWYYNRAEILRKNIIRDYSYPEIKDYLK